MIARKLSQVVEKVVEFGSNGFDTNTYSQWEMKCKGRVISHVKNKHF